MPGILVNIDVPEIGAAMGFYLQAFDLRLGRRFGGDVVELLGASAPIYLLRKAEGTPIGPSGDDSRRYRRHWTPVHLDLVVPDLDTAADRAVAAGALREGPTREAPYGRLALFADPFGHGFCLIEFNAQGYDALLPTAAPAA